ncbi:MAG: MurR/RpiR family transcriptional regulator [Traorella sp.]
MKTVLENIQNKYDQLFPAEKKVADCILKNMNDVINLNVSELSQLSNTSDATVVRTVKHLGYDGYYQMRLLLSKDIGKSEVKDESEDTCDSIKKFFLLEAERIIRLSESIDFSQLIEIANIIISANYTHLVAAGNTTTITADLGFRLERQGIRCTYSTLYEHYYNHITLGTNNDVVIAISRSGASMQVIRAVELAKKKNMKVIIITGELNATLTNNADYIIKINEMKNQVSTISKPDSHLQEYAINDALLYVIRSIHKVNNLENDALEDRDNIGILLSEFKQ